MERRRLGRTGHESSIAILGGAAFWQSTPEDAAMGLSLAVERGVNHIDIAPSYGDAERVVGPVLPAYRDRLFVACKTMRKNPEGVRAQLDDSLRRLGCDSFDLYQAHAVTSVDELELRARALDAIIAARDEGIVGFAGITGHDLGAPSAFLAALERWDLDTVMFPVYPRMWADPPYRAAAEQLLEVCTARDIGVMAIKATARRPWTTPASERPASPWYEPQPDRESLQRGIAFALSTPGVHAFCTPGDLGLLPLVLDAADGVQPLDDAARAQAIDQMASEPHIFPIPSA